MAPKLKASCCLVVASLGLMTLTSSTTIQASQKTATSIPKALRGRWVGYDTVTNAYYAQKLTTKTWRVGSGQTKAAALKALSKPKAKLTLSQHLVAGHTFTVNRQLTKHGYTTFKNKTSGWSHTSVTLAKRAKSHLIVNYDGRNLVRTVTMRLVK
ncbi:hypothetical protein [Lactiplantibacillus daowaiensis]|uniref:Extracellular protein n=1 Tax=Lactiplantibacillus daowaiensis TaxID=2559918 RepID=A0ABW1S362_9LACO|nr:hypothetical protein [Lactiplantibacillus daowaiensis]